jgi:ribosomal protein S18 acetylase RimI-like enzyme
MRGSFTQILGNSSLSSLRPLMVRVRKFDAADRAAIEDICYLTGYMGESAERFWRHKRSFVAAWTSYYIKHEPESIYVATKDDTVVGYLTGCVDTSFAAKSKPGITTQIMKHGLLFRPGTARFFWRAMLDSMRDKTSATDEFIDERWPSHLHINLLPVARGSGLGRALMERWFEQLRQVGSPGCHLGTLVENTRAVSFFERMGFKRYGEPSLVPGMRGLSGERLHQQVMVWSADPTRSRAEPS